MVSNFKTGLMCFTTVLVFFVEGVFATTDRNAEDFSAIFDEEYKKTKTLIKHGNVDVGLKATKSLASELDTRIRNCTDTQERQKYIRNYIRIGTLFDYAYSTVIKGGDPQNGLENQFKLKIEYADFVLDWGKLIDAENYSSPNSFRFVSSKLTQASLLMLEIKNKEKAEKCIEESIVILKRIAQRDTDWKTESELFRCELLEAYILTVDKGVKVFYDKISPLVDQYKNKEWVCQISMFIPYEIPGFIDSLDSMSLYSYYLLLESKLRNNAEDPVINTLYYRLGNTAALMELYDQAIKWYEIFLEKAPDSELNSIIRRLLDAYKKKSWYSSDKILEQIGMIEPTTNKNLPVSTVSDQKEHELRNENPSLLNKNIISDTNSLCSLSTPTHHRHSVSPLSIWCGSLMIVLVGLLIWWFCRRSYIQP